MEIKEYQEKAARTLLNKSDKLLSLEETKIIWCSQGLAGETGEVVDNLKKAIFHQHGINKEELKKELGDVLWYIAGLCTLLDFTLEEVMQLNINKLLKRYPEGYNSKDSIIRKI